jgi:hypothetical protein
MSQFNHNHFIYKKGTEMLRKIALIVCIVMFIGTAFAQDEPIEPERFDFPGGVYYFILNEAGERTNAMVVEPKRPMMTDRFARFGNIEIDPKTTKVTPEGVEIYDILDRLKVEDSGFYVFQAVVLRYDSVSLIKYNGIKWPDYVDKILKAFKE